MAGFTGRLLDTLKRVGASSPLEQQQFFAEATGDRRRAETLGRAENVLGPAARTPFGDVIARSGTSSGAAEGFNIGSPEAQSITVANLAREFPTTDPRSVRITQFGDRALEDVDPRNFEQLGGQIDQLRHSLTGRINDRTPLRDETLRQLTAAINDPMSASRQFADPALRALQQQAMDNRAAQQRSLGQLADIASGRDSLAQRVADIERDSILRQSASALRSQQGRFNPALARAEALGRNQALADLAGRTSVAAEQERRGALGALLGGQQAQTGLDIESQQAIANMARNLTADDRQALAALHGIQIGGEQQDIGNIGALSRMIGQRAGLEQIADQERMGLFGIGEDQRRRLQNMFLSSIGVVPPIQGKQTYEIVGNLSGQAASAGTAVALA